MKGGAIDLIKINSRKRNIDKWICLAYYTPQYGK